MGMSKRIFQTKREEAQWHYKHCEIETDTDPGWGTSGWCVEHNIDVTEFLADNYNDYDHEAGSDFEEAEDR